MLSSVSCGNMDTGQVSFNSAERLRKWTTLCISWQLGHGKGNGKKEESEGPGGKVGINEFWTTQRQEGAPKGRWRRDFYQLGP